MHAEQHYNLLSITGTVLIQIVLYQTHAEQHYILVSITVPVIDTESTVPDARRPAL